MRCGGAIADAEMADLNSTDDRSIFGRRDVSGMSMM